MEESGEQEWRSQEQERMRRQEAKTNRTRWWLLGVMGLVVCGLAGALILPIFLPIRNGYPRSYLRASLKQLVIAVHNYDDSYHTLPLSTRQNGEIPMHGWTTALLPFLEQPALYDSIDFDQAWNADVNRPAFEVVIPEMLRSPKDRKLPRNSIIDPHDSKTGYALTSFSANSHVINFAPGMSIKEITDNRSQTILIGEIRDEYPPWGRPGNSRDPSLGINRDPHGFGGFNTGGASFVFVDGRIDFLSEKIDPKVLEALATPTGGETIKEGEF